ncbi:hypothetical protein [Blastococcus sp. PRF04-17]|uniref:hypothetical protein n=1 Tax=Blastococcus sp. PRF04-17 TaxID=2933797 RepID=UPI001FF438FE|nr:hypothetical protein [Blastococcus sp. PRF04-17]UOY00245.1 hypothetical protein MVA48_14675 [Blastococcus sp. PRF04-17]
MSGLPGVLRFGVYPDFALAADGLVWVSNVEPGIVGFDPLSGEQRVPVPTGRIKVAMEYGLGSLWAVELSTGGSTTSLLRIEPGTGQVLVRKIIPLVVSNSSLAVTEDTVWTLNGIFGTPARELAALSLDGAVKQIHVAPDGATAVRAAFGSLWVSTTDAVHRIDPADGTTLATVDTGRGSGLMTVTEDAVWVLETLEGTVSRIDPETDTVVATVRVSDGPIIRGDIAAGPGSIWVRTSKELATGIDTATNTATRVLGPAVQGGGGIAVAEGVVWITTGHGHMIYRVPIS